MARRTPADRPQYILLTEAQRLFAFRSLKQVICYLDRRDCNVRQKSRGRRRHVCVGDLATALMSYDPRRHLEGIGRADAPVGSGARVDPATQAIERLQAENDTLRRRQGELRSQLRQAEAWCRKLRDEIKSLRSSWNDYLARETALRAEQIGEAKAAQAAEIDHLKGFLKNRGLFWRWEKYWEQVPILEKLGR